MLNVFLDQFEMLIYIEKARLIYLRVLFAEREFQTLSQCQYIIHQVCSNM